MDWKDIDFTDYMPNDEELMDIALASGIIEEGDYMDWELQQELEDFRREMEWEASLETPTKCDSCGATYSKGSMCEIGYGHKYLCDMCWDEAEEEDY